MPGDDFARGEETDQPGGGLGDGFVGSDFACLVFARASHCPASSARFSVPACLDGQTKL